MPLSNLRILSTSAIAVLVLLEPGLLGPAPHVQNLISPDEFVRAVATQRRPLINLYLSEGRNPNARAGQDRPLLLAATLQQDWETVRGLLKAGACVDLADDTGLTPLMAAAMHGNYDILRMFVGQVTSVTVPDRSGRTALHYAIRAQRTEVVDLLLRLMPDLGPFGSDLLATALDTGNKKISETILERLPQLSEWSSSTRRVLKEALAADNKDQIRLLLKKHSPPPTAEGQRVPLLAYALASNDTRLLTTLLLCGADPNTSLPDKCDQDFLDLLPTRFQYYIDGDKGINVLMLAAGLGQTDNVQALLDAGADKNRSTVRYKMRPLYLAARTANWRCTQILLGGGLPPDKLRIEIYLSTQKVALIKDGVPIFNTVCSTGRQGFATRAGSYVITDKNRSHRSTIYHVDMPYFMRLSCGDFGMHEGVVPNYPASHGCIRLPGDAARKLFAEIPVGTLVTVK